MSDKFKTKALGVINITPNSFSDPGVWLCHGHWKETIPKWRSWGVSYFDIGAQSTAPFNDRCSESEEWERFEEFLFPNLNLFVSGETLSFDTYRPQTFFHLYRKIKDKRPDLNLIFNDVSGVLDEELLSVLKECPDCLYVFSHTHVDSREQVPAHMNYVKEDLNLEAFFQGLISHFRQAEERFIKEGLSERVIFDPCFGFSKSAEQNIYILNQIEQLFRSFPKNCWLIGVSRKSFLQDLQPQNLSKQERKSASESLHCAIISQIILRWMGHIKMAPLFSSDIGQNLFLRIHDPLVYRNSVVYVREFFLK